MEIQGRSSRVIATMRCTEPGSQGGREGTRVSIDNRLTKDRWPVDHNARAPFGPGVGLAFNEETILTIQFTEVAARRMRRSISSTYFLWIFGTYHVLNSG